MASPYGFADSTREFIKILKDLLVREKFEPVDPWDLTSPNEIAKVESISDPSRRAAEWSKLNRTIGERNRAALDSCDWVLGCLDGPDVDSGTASEIGYAFGVGKRIIGYRGDFRLSGDNEGTIVNLQVQYWIEASGGTIVRSLEDLARTVHLDKSKAGNQVQAAGGQRATINQKLH